MQGVRQLAPRDVCASAPGGSDSIVSETLGPPPPPSDQLGMLGIQLPPPQPETRRAPATAHTRTIGVIATPLPRPLPGRPPVGTIRVPRSGRNIWCTGKAAARRQQSPAMR